MDNTFWGTMLTDIGAVISWVFSVLTDSVLPAILDNSVLFLFVIAVPLVGIGIGVFNRLKAA